MFKIEFYDNLTRQLFSPWWMYLLLGLNFILLAVLIFLFPEFLAWIVAIFLLANGVLFLGLAWNSWKVRGSYQKWKTKHSIPVQ
jgi:hypothetical protein